MAASKDGPRTRARFATLDCLSHRLLIARSYATFARLVGEFLRSFDGASEALLIAPTKGAADDLARRCSPSGVLGLHRMTLNQLAASAATPRMVAEGKAPASRLGVEAIAARVVHQLRKEGRIPYFGPVSTTPGFSRALTTTLTELRLEGVDSTELLTAGEPGKDLGALLALYEKTLDETSLADLATLLRMATSAALEGRHRFAGMPLILVDPPLDSALSRDLLAALISRSPRVLAVTLSADGETLARMLDVPAEDVNPSGADADLDRVQTWLFSPQAPPSDLADDTLDYFSAPGEGMECVEIARRIRILTGAGIPFDRVAVLLRDPERYQPFLEEALRRAGIPAHFSRGVVRPDPAGRAFLALLACARDGCSATRFSEYLSLGQVPSPDRDDDPVSQIPLDDELLATFIAIPEAAPARPEAPADDTSPVINGTLQSPIGWEALLVDAAVIGARTRIGAAAATERAR